MIAVGALFTFLSLASAASAYLNSEPGGVIPAVVFLCVGSVALVVGTLGSNSAVSKMWGAK